MLDAKRPGWAQRMDLDNFHIRDCHKCVLGQLFGEFFAGAVELGLQHPADQMNDVIAAARNAKETEQPQCEQYECMLLGFDMDNRPQGPQYLKPEPNYEDSIGELYMDFKSLQSEWLKVVTERVAAATPAQ